jgi:hypothetical protein
MSKRVDPTEPHKRPPRFKGYTWLTVQMVAEIPNETIRSHRLFNRTSTWHIAAHSVLRGLLKFAFGDKVLLRRFETFDGSIGGDQDL